MKRIITAAALAAALWQAHPAPLLSAPTPSARWVGTSPRPLCRA